MTAVTIYTTNACPYCAKAKSLLRNKKVEFKEIDVTNDEALRDAMTLKTSGRRSVPQIFIGSHHVGGCDDLHALESQGKLDGLLAA